MSSGAVTAVTLSAPGDVITFAIGPAAVPLPAPGLGRPVWFEHLSLDAPVADRLYPAAVGWGVAPAGQDTRRAGGVTDPSGAIFTLLTPP